MPNRKLSYAVDVDSSSAVRDLRRLGTEGARAGRELADGFDDAESAGTKALAALSTNLERLEADVTGTAKAVRAVGQAAGDGFDSARIEAFVTDLNRMGVSFDEIEGKAGEFADVMRRADQVKLDAANQGLTTVGTNLDGVRDSADQSRSVLANMVGNTAQDLGELGGVAGTAGVAIGQLAEYAADGNVSLQNFAKILGPLAAIGGTTAAIREGFKLVNDQLGASDERVAALRENMSGLTIEAGELLTTIAADTDALELPENVTVSWDDYKDVLQEIVHIGDGLDETDVATILDKANISLSAFARTATHAGDEAEGLAQFNGMLVEALEAGRITTEEYDAALRVFVRTQDDVRDAEVEARNEAENLALSLDDINRVMSEGRTATLGQAEAWNILVGDMADGTLNAHNAATAWNFLRDEIGLTDDQIAETLQSKLDEKLEADAEAATAAAEAHDELAAAIAGAVAGMDSAESRTAAFTAALDKVNGAASELTQAQEGIGFADNLRTLGDALAELGDDAAGVDLVPDDWAEFQNIPDELRPVVDALAGFRDSVQSELAQAFETGGATGVHQWANQTRQAVEQTMAAAGVEIRTASGEYTDAAEQILSALGLLPDQVITTVEVAVEQQQLAVLGEVTSALDDLPASKRAQIELAINGGDPATALALINEHLLSIGQEPISLDIVGTTNAGEVADEFDEAAEDRETSIDADTNADQAGGDLDDAAVDRDTTISANVRQQIIEGLILGAYLDWVARPREARIDTELYGWATAAAVLNAVAKSRTAPVVVELPNYWTAEAALDRLARARYSRIYTTRSSGGATPVAAEASALTADVDGLAAAAVDTPIVVSDPLPAVATPQTVNNYYATVSAGVIGSSHEVRRAVRDALAQSARLGQRPW